MNKVSWRRILQRAGHEFPNERRASVTQMREGSQTRENPRAGWGAPLHPSDPGAGVLESELKRALDRAARRDSESKAAATGTPPGWEPIFMAQEVTGKALAPAPRPRPDAAGLKRASSGGRNILAISVSAAVVGLAFQQISTQWNQSRISNGVSAVPEATTSSASVLYANGATNDSQSGYGVQPSDDDPQELLRPSLTDNTPPLTDNTPPPGAGSTQEQDVFLTEIEQAASVLAAQPKREPNRAPVTPVSAPLRDTTADLDSNAVSGADEQAMLRRARELMERGHVSGARLIFEHLALQQSALGAFALAQTYDEKFLKTYLVKGMEADPKLAAKWYRRAAELGSQFAAKN
jgi:hypothetical protein